MQKEMLCSLHLKSVDAIENKQEFLCDRNFEFRIISLRK